MKAVGYQKSLPIDDPQSLQDIDQPDPTLSGRDLLVDVKAVSVNPVDTKVRRNAAPAAGQWKILGWDAAGVVRSAGPEAVLFKPGDRVWYAGDLTRSGANAERHLVDERVAGPMPGSLDFAPAAALPLTAITAWELLFDRLAVPQDPRQGGALLVIGAAGGVGSILVQFARRLTGLTVIGTASRPETKEWVLAFGAHHVIDHSRPLKEGLAGIGFGEVTYVVGLTQTERHFPQIAECLAPYGKLAVIDDFGLLDIGLLKRKSVSIHWEFMFTRTMFKTKDMIQQQNLLRETAALVDAGTIRTTVGEHFGRINAANLRRAHARIESGKTVGKIVLEGF